MSGYGGKRTYQPDFKSPKTPKPSRFQGKSMTTTSCLEWRECPCGKPSATGHHVVARGRGGDDVLANILPLCGSGTTGCHGLIENEDVKTRKMIGKWIKLHRPDTIAYVQGKMGREAGDDWLRRRLYLTVSARGKKG